jgi:DNA-binding NarL/FixJ family response regulator
MDAPVKKIRIILADKHVNVLGAIRNLLETEAETVLMVADETSLWHALENSKPDVVVVDLSFPFSSGNNAGRALKNRYPSTKVIILSLHDEKSVLDAVTAAKVEGFVLKRRAVIDLIPAIREILQGRRFISREG